MELACLVCLTMVGKVFETEVIGWMGVHKPISEKVAAKYLDNR